MMDRTLPYYTRVMMQTNLEKHKRKVREAKSMIKDSLHDNHETFLRMHTNNHSRILEHKRNEIDRENKILLEKLTTILHRSDDDESRNRRARILNGPSRRMTQTKITRENQELYERLKNARSIYEIDKLQRSRQHTERILQNISRYPYIRADKRHQLDRVNQTEILGQKGQEEEEKQDNLHLPKVFSINEGNNKPEESEGSSKNLLNLDKTMINVISDREIHFRKTTTCDGDYFIIEFCTSGRYFLILALHMYKPLLYFLATTLFYGNKMLKLYNFEYDLIVPKIKVEKGTMVIDPSLIEEKNIYKGTFKLQDVGESLFKIQKGSSTGQEGFKTVEAPSTPQFKDIPKGGKLIPSAPRSAKEEGSKTTRQKEEVQISFDSNKKRPVFLEPVSQQAVVITERVEEQRISEERSSKSKEISEEIVLSSKENPVQETEPYNRQSFSRKNTMTTNSSKKEILEDARQKFEPEPEVPANEEEPINEDPKKEEAVHEEYVNEEPANEEHVNEEPTNEAPVKKPEKEEDLSLIHI
eukprot:TRINITY_DN4363_c0_g1_i2.p1 TRINITY_DN4363_c0_g1~~TRINITY_DN4363_c0_g1_i2.p1  ORF type:complete len:528 (-),score=87.23 TRINITY_DN4363_c0_g1_i2:60-1643(-)